MRTASAAIVAAAAGRRDNGDAGATVDTAAFVAAGGGGVAAAGWRSASTVGTGVRMAASRGVGVTSDATEGAVVDVIARAGAVGDWRLLFQLGDSVLPFVDGGLQLGVLLLLLLVVRVLHVGSLRPLVLFCGRLLHHLLVDIETLLIGRLVTLSFVL
jgi:hypothetical protein